jgi:hypothetical protein
VPIRRTESHEAPEWKPHPTRVNLRAVLARRVRYVIVGRRPASEAMEPIAGIVA